MPKMAHPAVRQFVVPLLHDALQNDLEKLIQKSHDAAKEARRLLDQAKRMVERAILGE